MFYLYNARNKKNVWMHIHIIALMLSFSTYLMLILKNASLGPMYVSQNSYCLLILYITDVNLLNLK